MPVVLLLMGAATLALVAANSHAKTPKSRPASPYQLDPHMDATLRSQVEAELNYDTDPARLEAFAHALEAQYPYAGWYLRAKAEGLRRLGYGAAGVQPTTGDPGLDANLPDDVRFNVVELLSMGTDAAALEAFAAQLSAYPKAQAALRVRAAFLRATQGAAPAPNLPGAPAPEPAPTFPALPGFDANLSPQDAMQIAQVLMTENDPAKLRALAASIQAHYPLAAAMLLAKANAIAPPASPSPIAPSPAPVFVPPTPSPSPSAGPVFVPPTPVSTVPDLPSPSPQPSPGPLQLPPLPMFPGLDAGMTPEDAARITTALTTESDPAKLRALADAIASRFPNAALLLTNKAAAISALLLPGSGGTPGVPVHYTPEPPPAVTPVMARTYKVQEGDFPIKIAKKFGRPESAWKELVAANPQKSTGADGNFKSLRAGDVLKLPASWPDAPGSVSAPSPSPVVPPPSVAPPAVAVVPPGTAALDPGIPANVAQAVLTALASENDPAALRGFASSIMQTYPIAAGVLLAKANTLGTFVNVSAPGPSGTPSVVPPIVHLPTGSATPTVGTRIYHVAKGDSPSRIAKKLTGSDARWPELVSANPQKPKKADGNFQSLQPGEVLTLPSSWPAAPTNGAPVHAATAAVRA